MSVLLHMENARTKNVVGRTIHKLASPLTRNPLAVSEENVIRFSPIIVSNRVTTFQQLRSARYDAVISVWFANVSVPSTNAVRVLRRFPRSQWKTVFGECTRVGSFVRASCRPIELINATTRRNAAITINTRTDATGQQAVDRFTARR